MQDSELKKEELRQIEWKYLQLNNFNPINLEKRNYRKILNILLNLFLLYINLKIKKYEDEGLTKEQISNRSNNAQRLLERVTIFKDYENLTLKELKYWVEEAQKGFIEADRIDIGNDAIGKLLSKAPNGKDEVFPSEIVRDILEEFKEDIIGKAFIHGVMYPNGHRSTMRAYDAGGEQEYNLANGYRRDAETLKIFSSYNVFFIKKISKRL